MSRDLVAALPSFCGAGLRLPVGTGSRSLRLIPAGTGPVPVARPPGPMPGSASAPQ